jgi:hypothetical protein
MLALREARRLLSYCRCFIPVQRTTNTYILDFRAPVSAVVAFAAMCATHAAKPLVNA